MTTPGSVLRNRGGLPRPRKGATDAEVDPSSGEAAALGLCLHRFKIKESMNTSRVQIKGQHHVA